MKTPSVLLDHLTRTFTADQQFFDEMMAQPAGGRFVEMCIWYLWLHDYLHDIQDSLTEAAKAHSKEYQVWVVSMAAGAAQSIGMLMYLLCRGVVHEASAAGRRALEYLGMMSHLVRDPSKARFLVNPESQDFERAFIRGQDRNAAQRLKAEGIRYRFSGMSAGNAKAATGLYAVFSRFNVHGGTISSLVSLALTPTGNSCAFHNRSLEHIASQVPLFGPLLEITAIELMDLVARHGTPSQRISQAGACVLVWLNRDDPRWLERVRAMRLDLGLREANEP